MGLEDRGRIEVWWCLRGGPWLHAAPRFVIAGFVSICPNLFTQTASSAWSQLTGTTPWWATPHPTNACDQVMEGTFESLLPWG